MANLTNKERILLQLLGGEAWEENKDKIMSQFLKLNEANMAGKAPDLFLAMGFAFAYGYSEGCRHIIERVEGIKVDYAAIGRERVVQ